MNLKGIHIGKLIHQTMEERLVPIERAAKFLKCNEEDIQEMFRKKSIDTELLLRWSKLLKYDFFRVYTGHLILYSPPVKNYDSPVEKSNVPVFRKSVYTQDVINFILEKISTKQMTPQEVILTYSIPKTTLYKWIKKKE